MEDPGTEIWLQGKEVNDVKDVKDAKDVKNDKRGSTAQQKKWIRDDRKMIVSSQTYIILFPVFFFFC